MGGCRCTYRNCTMRSDGQTHMFHYPVFDKPRCHQWLVNAQRLDFLSLKVSQLKNRVLCQHHFRDDCFMNFKKAKLKFDAVPTEDGPYCETVEEPEDTASPDNGFPIIFEDIENEQLSCIEKKATFSVKYSDFLTNCEVSDPSLFENLTTNIVKPTVPKKDDCLSLDPVIRIRTSDLQKQKVTEHSKLSKKPKKNVKSNIKILSDLKIENPLITKDATKSSISMILPGLKNNLENVKNWIEIKIIDEQSSKNTDNHVKVIEHVVNNYPEQYSNKSQEKKVVNYSAHCDINKSEEKEEDIRLQDDKQNQICIIQNLQSGPSNLDLSALIAQDITSVPNTKQAETSYNKRHPQSLLNPITNDNIVVSQTLPNTKSLRNKIPLERAAAIAEKRKLNKQKLSDMIGFYLDDLADDSKNQKRKKQMIIEETNMPEIQPQNNNVSVVQHSDEVSVVDKNVFSQEEVKQMLSREEDLPSFQEYTLAALAARMNRMEDILLKKIDYNSEKIVDLTKSISSAKSDVRSESTQTFEDEETRKRNLFNQISQYLKPDTKSIIYEELFINKYVPKVGRTSTPTVSYSGIKEKLRKGK